MTGTPTLLQIAGTIFAVLFLINWICTLSAQKVNGFRWGDFVLCGLMVAVLFANAGRLRAFVSVVPDTTELLTIRTKDRLREVQTGIQDTRQTVGQVTDYLKDVAQREMDYQMQLSAPPKQ